MLRTPGLAVVLAVSAVCAWSLPAAATVIAYTDRTAWETAAGGPFVTDTFDGPKQTFAPNSVGNVPSGSTITVDIQGDVGDNKLQGPNGGGFYWMEVDPDGPDEAEVFFNFPQPIYSVAFVDLRAISVDGVQAFFVGTQSVSPTFSRALSLPNGGAAPFLGFVSDRPFSTINFFHGSGLGAAFNEDWWQFDDLLYSSAIPQTPAPVDAPGPLALLGLGLAGLALARRGKRTA